MQVHSITVMHRAACPSRDYAGAASIDPRATGAGLEILGGMLNACDVEWVGADDLNDVESPPEAPKEAMRLNTANEKRVQAVLQDIADKNENPAFNLEFIDNEWRYVEIDPERPGQRRAFALDDPEKSRPIFLLRPEPTLTTVENGKNRRPKRRRSQNDHSDEHELAAILHEQNSTAHAINRLVSMLREAGDPVKEMAADALGNVARNPDDIELVVAAGAIPVLISVMKKHTGMVEPESHRGSESCYANILPLEGANSCNDQLVEVVANTLSIIVCNPEHITNVVVNGAIPILVSILRHNSNQLKEVAADTLSIIARHELHSSAVVEAGAAPALVSMLIQEPKELKQAAAFTLSIISQKHAMAVVEAGALPMLVSILVAWICDSASATHVNSGLDEVVVNTISNIARDKDVTQAVVDAGTIPVLVSTLQNGAEELQKASAEAVSYIAKHELHTEAVVKGGAVPVLVSLMQGGSTELKEVAADALRGVARNQTYTSAVVNAGGIPVLVSMVNGWADELKEVAADVLSSIARNQAHTQAVVAAGAVPMLKNLLQGWVDELKEVAADALSNIARNPLFTAAVVGESGLLVLLVGMLQEGNDELKRAAAETLSVVARNPAHTQAVLAAGAVPALWALLQAGNEDLEEIVSEALHIIHPNLLDDGIHAAGFDTSTTAGYESNDSSASAGNLNCTDDEVTL